jgi:PadR family transcriptional regulator AphA
MNTRLVTINGCSYVDCLPGEPRLAGESEALDLVAACGEHRTHRLMLHEDNLTEDFYQLRTGVAGAVLQKFVNYFIRVAAVLPAERVNQGRFAEMVLESNRGNQFRVFQSRQLAEAWLIRE